MWQIFITLFVVLLNSHRFVNCLNCDSLVHSPESEGNGTANGQFFVAELAAADYKELLSCLATIGQDPMPQEQANNVWSALKKHFTRIDDIPAECYIFMGYSLLGIPVDDFQNITLDSIEIVTAFGKYHGLKQEQMSAVTEAVIRDWSEKVPTTLSEFDLIALGQVLCHFNKTDIARIHPDAYKGAAQVIGELRDCPVEITQTFAKLAIDAKAFGAPSTWSQFDVAVVGNIISGLPAEAYAQIPEQYIKDMKKKKTADKKAAGTE